MGFNIVGFWAVGFVLGWALAFKADLGLSGIWLGILSGSLVVGMALTTHMLNTFAQKVLSASGCGSCF